MTLNRRQFLGYSLSAVASASFSAVSRASTPELVGRIHGVSTLNPLDHGQELSSVVTINLADGNVSYTPLPEHKLGHSLTPLSDGGYFAVPYGVDDTPCLFLHPDLTVSGRFEAPDGYGFGGHAAVLPGGEKIVGHFNQAGYELDKRRPDQTGQLFLLDVRTQSLEKVIDTGILHGHDVIVSRDGKSIIIGDDGTTEVRSPEQERPDDDPFALVAPAPSLSVYSIDSLTLVKTIPLEINGSFVHIEQDKKGFVYGSAEQYVSRNEAGFSALFELLGDDGDVERYVHSLSEDDYELELPYPGPLMRIDPVTMVAQSHLTPNNQAPFDIKINEYTGRVFNAFTASGMLARFDPLTERWGFFSTREYGVEQPYGLTDIPGTHLMAVNGFKEGLAVFDTLTMSLVKYFHTENHGVKHLLYQS